MISRAITTRQLELLRAIAGAGSLAAALRTLGLTGAPGQITSLRRRGLLEWGSARLNADALLEVVSDRCGERINDGRAHMGDPSAAKRSLRKIVQRHICAEDAAADVIEWAELFFELDPSSYCDGRNPLPIEYVRGGWVYGDPAAEPSEDPLAVIVYVTEPSPETGDVGWCWWVDGRMGSATTLAAAMARCADEMARKDMP